MSKAFSILEILIVITIISILTTLCLPNYSKYIVRAKITLSICRIDLLCKANLLYKIDYNTFLPFENFTLLDDGWSHIRDYIDLGQILDPFSITENSYENLHLSSDSAIYDKAFDYAPGLSNRYYKRNQRRCIGNTHYYSYAETFLIDGVGPDNFDDIKSGCFSVGCSTFTNKRRLAIAYNSSNGLMSKGDIFKIFPKAPLGFEDLFH